MISRKVLRLRAVSGVVIAGFFCLSLVPFSSQASATGGAVEISSCNQLLAIDDSISNRTKDYKLVANINCANIANFTPIGLGGSAWAGVGYAGIFDGQNHSISNLKINSTGVDNVGLFSQLDDGTIKNLVLKSGSVTSDGDSIGSVVGYIDGGGSNGMLNRVCSHINVTGDDRSDQVGGLVGEVYNALISQTCATGNVTGDDSIGGLIGYADDEQTIDQSYSTGLITADDDVGGLVGYSDDDITITDSYSLSNIISQDECGGVVGYSYEVFTFRTYYAGIMDCDYEDGLVGDDYDTYDFTDTFWDLRGGENPSSTNGDLYGATAPRTTAQMKNIATFTTDINLIQPWNFTTVWQISSGVNNGYPSLRWSIIPSTDDLDGVSAEIESAGPNGGDANNDGTPDSEQTEVTSIVNATTGKYIVLETSGVCSNNESVLAEKETEVTAEDDDDYDYPVGLLDFSLTGCGAGDTELITQYYFGDFDVNSFVARKYNKTNDTYMAIDSAVLSSVSIGGESAIKVVYSVTDGGTLDQDGAANGTIVDPVGLGIVVLAETGTSSLLTSFIGIIIALVPVGLFLSVRKKLTNDQSA